MGAQRKDLIDLHSHPLAAAAGLLISAALLLSCTTTAPAPQSTTEDHSSEDPPEEGYRYGIGGNLPDEMPVLSVLTENEQEISSRTDYISAEIALEEPTGDYCFEARSAGIRCRGNYSYYGEGIERKSYRLRFDEKTDPLGIGKGASRSWVLLANWIDRSMLRNVAALTMAERLGFSACSDFAFVELYLNGEYRGVYLMLEQHSIGKLRINIDEEPDVLDSDYLIELDMRASTTGTEGVDYFVSREKQYVVKNDAIHPDAMTFLADFFDRLGDAIEAEDRAAVEEMVDIDSFVDMYILQEYAMNYDVGFASLYMVKNAGGKLEMTFPWDFDLAFGNYSVLGDSVTDIYFVGNSVYQDRTNANEMFWRLMGQEWFSDLVRARFAEIGSSLRDAATAEIERILAVYTDEFERNYRAFPILGQPFSTTPSSIASLTDYRAVAGQLLGWISDRFDYLEGLWIG